MNPFDINPAFYEGDVDELLNKCFGMSGFSVNFNAYKFLSSMTREYDWSMFENGYVSQSSPEERRKMFCDDVDDFVYLALKLNEGLERDAARLLYGGFNVSSFLDSFAPDYKSEHSTETLGDLVSQYSAEAKYHTKSGVHEYTMQELVLKEAAGLYQGMRERVFRASMKLNFQNYQSVFPTARAVLHDPVHIAKLLADPSYTMSEADTLEHFRKYRDASFPILNSMSLSELSVMVPDPGAQMLQASGRYQNLKAAYDRAAEVGVEESRPTPEVKLDLVPGDADAKDRQV